MRSSEDFIELTSKLLDLFKKRDDSYTLCVVIGEIECALLRFIHKENRPMTMKEIAKKYKISKSKVTRIISHLVKKGFVERYHSESDRRKLFARITDEGTKMAQNTKYKLNKFQKEVLKLIPVNDIDNIYDCLRTFVIAYEDAIKNSKEE